MRWLAKIRSLGACTALKLVLLCIGVIVLAGQLYSLYRFIAILTISLMLDEPIIADNINRSSIKNSRGDTIKIEHEFPLGRNDPEHLVIRLKRAHHWLSATLLKAESHGINSDTEWLDQNTLEITLAFGCLVRMKTPVTTAGPIKISYRLTEGNQALGSCPPGVSPRSEPLPARIPENH